MRVLSGKSSLAKCAVDRAGVAVFQFAIMDFQAQPRRQTAVARGWQQRLEEGFAANFAGGGECGASVAVCGWGGEVLAQVHHGFADRARSVPWTERTLVPVYSCTKGPAAATLLRLLFERGLGPELAVGELWPRFPQARATIAEVLNHQCGLAWLDEKADVRDHAGVVQAIEAQAPAWMAPETGYHPRTWGALVEELCLRLSGAGAGAAFRTWFGDPLALDFWIGLPASEEGRVAELLTGRLDAAAQADPVYQALAQEGSEPRRAFASPRGLNAVAEMNSAEAHGLGQPAFGGVGSAVGLAQFYAYLAGEEAFPQWLRAQLGRHAAQTPKDRILLRPLRFALGFQQDPLDENGAKTAQLYGSSPQAFGHPGAGGSHAFADPESGLGFAYTMNQMALSVLPGGRARRLVEALGD